MSDNDDGTVTIPDEVLANLPPGLEVAIHRDTRRRVERSEDRRHRLPRLGRRRIVGPAVPISEGDHDV